MSARWFALGLGWKKMRRWAEVEEREGERGNGRGSDDSPGENGQGVKFRTTVDVE